MKKVSSVIFYYLTEFHCLVVFTSEDNEQYMCCNCLIPRMRCNKFEIKHIFLIKPFLCMTKSQGKYINISRRKKTFKVKKIMFFIIIKGCVRPESPVLRWVTGNKWGWYQTTFFCRYVVWNVGGAHWMHLSLHI